jgi:DNA-directed RNA polymerase specialized sigma24 family protein
MGRDLRLLPLRDIASECRAQTSRFLRGDESHDEFCWELIRRAIVDRDQPAWEAFFAQYRGIVLSWIRRHPASDRLAEEPEYWVNRAFERFWVALTAERFGMFPSLASLLRYLQLCINSILVDATRSQAREQVAPWPEGERGAPVVEDPATGIVGELASSDLWRVVSAEAQSDQELLIARLCFALGLKPREICERYPTIFPDANAVYRSKRNFIERLRRNPVIREMLDG